MIDIPSADLRTNLATFAVPHGRIPAVAGKMVKMLPCERYDPQFAGQTLKTTYFDTSSFTLRKARLNKDAYITLRLRRYDECAWALSAKIKEHKYRVELDPTQAQTYLDEGLSVANLPATLPAPFVTRLLELIGGHNTVPVVTVKFYRYAVEDACDRLTLDVGIRTDTGKRFPSAVLEAKSTQRREDHSAADPFQAMGLRPLRLSKFLWATATGHS